MASSATSSFLTLTTPRLQMSFALCSNGRDKLEERAIKESNPLAILKARYPEDWGDKAHLELSGDIAIHVHRGPKTEGEG